MRPIYYAGLFYIALAVVLSVRSYRPEVPVPSVAAIQLSPELSLPVAWFQSVKQHCNPVEVEIQHKYNPPPLSDEGWGYSAACFALAGKIQNAREAIENVKPNDRWRAAGIVFGVVHPVADAGDDVAAGPMMELVLEFWPNHYMALYHAGISNYSLGNHTRARDLLSEFLVHYSVNDGWTRNAETVLQRLSEK